MSFWFRFRKPLVFALLSLLLFIALFLGASHGTVQIHTTAIVVDSLFGELVGGWEEWQRLILLYSRMPRVIVGMMVGGALALAGAVMQGVFRNPMADPGVIGVSGGASLGAVIAIASGLALRFPAALPLCAFAVACGCAFLVYIVATVRGQTSVVTLLLAGIAVGGVASSLTSFLLSYSMSDFRTGQRILHWLMGGLDGRNWTHVWLSAPLIVGGSLLLLVFARDLNVLAGGEETAQTLGVNVALVRAVILFLATAVTSAAVAVSGTLVFVGLMVPHILRMLIGPEHRSLMIASFLGGGSLVVFGDLLARTVIAPEEIRLGVITSLLGGPFFLYLLVIHKLRVENM